MDKITYTEKRLFEWHEGEVSDQRSIYCCERVNALCWDDWKGPNNQYVEAGKLIVEVWDANGN